MDKILLNKREAAGLLSISPRLLETLIARGEVKVCRIGRRVLVARRTLEEFSRRSYHPTQTSELRKEKADRGTV